MDVSARVGAEVESASPREMRTMLSGWGFIDHSDPSRLATEYLGPRGVPLDLFETSGGEIVADAHRLDPIFPREPAIIFRFYNPTTGEEMTYSGEDGARRPFIRMRRLGDGQPKFLQPRDSGTHVYFAPLTTMEWPMLFADTSYGLVVSEGETRALAGAACDLPVIALTGVDCGQLNGQLHPDLNVVDWRDRSVFLTFDSDTSRKENVQRALLRLSALLRGRGAAVSQVNLPSMPDGSKQGLDDYLARHGRAAFEALLGSSETILLSDDDTPEPPTALADLMGRAYPPTEWAWAGFVLKGEGNLLYGDGGVGKSLLALNLGVAVAAGKSFAGNAVTQMPVIALFAEDGPSQVKQRVEQALISLGLDHRGNLPMHLWCQPSGDVTLARVDESGVVTPLPRLLALRGELAALGVPALVILDSFADLFALNENLRLPVNAALKKVLGALCRDYGATVLVLAHPSKASILDGSKYSGSTAFNNGVRQRLTLEFARSEDDGASDRLPLRVLRVAKSNYGVVAEKTLIYRGASISAESGADGATPEEEERAVLSTMLNLIVRGIRVVRGNGSGQKPVDVTKAVREQHGLVLTTKQVLHYLGMLERKEMLAYRNGDKNARPAVHAGFIRGSKCPAP